MIKAKRLPSLTRKHQISPQKIVSQPAEDKIAVIDREELDSRKSIENGVNDTTNKLDKTEENAESISISLVKGEKEIRHENP